MAKNEFAFSFRPTRKDQQVGGNMLMFDVHVNMKSLGFVLKMTRFNDSKSILYFERLTLYTMHFQFNSFHSLRAVTLHESSFSKIHHWDTLISNDFGIKEKCIILNIQCIVGYCYKYTCAVYDCFSAPGTHSHSKQTKQARRPSCLNRFIDHLSHLLEFICSTTL